MGCEKGVGVKVERGEEGWMKRGVESRDHWFYIATRASRALVLGDGRVSRDKIQRRLDCMLCWWKHRCVPPNATLVTEWLN